MRDFGDFEDAAKKSWQSFSTMKRFVCEASRLEYASWRLWYMHKQWKPLADDPSQHSAHGPRKRGASASASASTPNEPHSPTPMQPPSPRFDPDAAPRRRPVCVYCDEHTASLSCHGCCHDEYCVACFKLVHKRGHLATHTAVKLKESSAAASANGSGTGILHPSLSSSAVAALDDATKTEARGNAVDGESHAPSTAGSSPTSSQSHSMHNAPLDEREGGADGARTKSWELQLDVLLQRLMINTVHHDNDISVHNIDECESLGTESEVSYPYLSGSEDHSGHHEYALSRLDEHTDDMQAASPVFTAAASTALEAAVRPISLSPALSPALHPLEARDGIPPLGPSGTLVRTKSRHKNLICANCNGNHITIDCPLLESSLPSGQAGVGTVLRKCFTTLHNDNLSDSTHAFLGDEVSVRGGNHFTKPILTAPDRIAKGASLWTTFGMNSISEDQTADVHDTLPILASLQPDRVQPWDSTSWLMTALATQLPLDVFESLRKAERDPTNKSAFDVDPSISGWIYLRQPGSKWCKRYVCLLRNNLWEYLDDKDTTRPIGHANVGEGVVDVLQNTSTEFALAYYRDSSPNASCVECMIRCETAAETRSWRDALIRATQLSVDDLFDRSPGSPDSPVAAHELGKGRFANVHRARRKSLNAEFCEGLMDCALKIIDKPTFWGLVSRDTERDDTVVREILTQTVLTVRAGTSFCPVIRLLSVFETRNELVMELELMREGDLHEEIVANTAVSEARASFLVSSLVRAIDFCHKNGVAHRDVKLSNLALDYCTSPRGERHSVIKIADFGMAAFVYADGTLKGRCGTPGFVAPEILTAGKGESYPATVDMFSVGVVTYTMLCGYEPFFGVNDEELIQMNKAAEYDFEEPEWASISPEAKDLIAMMMEKDPIKRITPKEALDHPFVHEANAQLEQILRVETTICALRLL